ncbi:SDR family oxidoreductase [Jannaschia sp. CCS1]|uniref:SDR family oxidoreductase n=1 Tax=Jannaschia sp. (strain CCS1) TaxID=290400 RepID=UPI000053DD14|nr:SDR family oxidoreductase [Jannaschia sp. CCS1]ABD55376.1 NAD-dependent epimerase/dehydratase [Jannaschia sp. CCS1]
MRCLVVGGTGFLGGAIVDALVDAGQSVSILSRGVTSASHGAGVEMIRADRYEDLTPLENRPFDWVFDTCAYTPASVERLLDAVGPSIARYVLISSVSAYGTFLEDGQAETAIVPDATPADFEAAARLAREDRASAFAYGASYGPLKRACERKADEMLGDRATSLRVGLLVGAGDYSDRLTWWVRRLDQARDDRKRVPAPAPDTRLVQMIDVRDVARFALRCGTDDLGGIWNVTGAPTPMGAVLSLIAELSQSDAEIVWVKEDDIVAEDIAPWSDIPLMAPPIPEFRYFLSVGTEKANAAGLTCRPLRDTILPLLAWDRGRREVPLTCGMTAEQEARLLDTAQ